MPRRPLLGIALTALLLAGCADDSTPAASEPSETAATFSLDDREEFLAGGPSCEELQGWYEQFPADTDGLTALTYTEECAEAPPALLEGDVYAGSNPRILEALLAPDVTGPSRALAHETLGEAACGVLAKGEKSLYAVAQSVADVGGQPDDYRAVIDSALEQCPDKEDVLTLFSTDDVLGATDDYEDALLEAGAPRTLLGSGGEVAALASVVCDGLRAGDDIRTTSLLLGMLLDSDEAGDQLAVKAGELFCPENL